MTVRTQHGLLRTTKRRAQRCQLLHDNGCFMSFSPIIQSTIGLDVHGKILVACHLTKDDETGKVAHEFGTFSTFSAGLEELAKRVDNHGNFPVMRESANVYRMMP
ncbi:MAG: hypothetical protein LBO66_13445 [Deltaproteobacteria bacterium]|jgi:hypothetical protein|nr:hypothetical protein [Deltaproteobacteria bacterium]